jgi:hypothetical protein
MAIHLTPEQPAEPPARPPTPANTVPSKEEPLPLWQPPPPAPPGNFPNKGPQDV